MSQINSNTKDDFQVVLLLSCFVGHPVFKNHDYSFLIKIFLLNFVEFSCNISKKFCHQFHYWVDPWCHKIQKYNLHFFFFSERWEKVSCYWWTRAEDNAGIPPSPRINWKRETFVIFVLFSAFFCVQKSLYIEDDCYKRYQI